MPKINLFNQIFPKMEEIKNKIFIQVMRAVKKHQRVVDLEKVTTKE